MKSLSSFIAGFLLFLAVVISPLAVAATSLEQAVSERMARVTEFQFIRKEAEKLGVRVWLFGGTAAGFGHYVKWDLLREAGDHRFQPNRFDYDYTNIYRSTQDLDIVIDGSPEQVAALQAKLEEAFPHFQGSRTVWEVRSLRQKIRDKEALLNAPDFLNQHTDSNSTGMIEITKPVKGEAVIRDLRAWSDPNPAFLRDVKGDKLHFYFSPSHFTTSRAKEGLNPPILSALRYLTKAFQYELEIDPESLANLQKIIADFNPDKDLANDAARKQLEKNAKKMIQHAVNLEYARDWLDRLGLRKKLIKLGEPEEVDSMAWWLSKEPLKTSPLGAGKGKTAAELAHKNKWPRGPRGEIVVAHETNNFLAYESITRAHTGDPNVFISRDGFEGEAAAYGDGFYTRLGREGARHTGITIRFELDPNARLGTDFTLHDDYVVVLNKKAIRVIPESLNLDPVSYFRFLAKAEGVDASDKALMEKLGRRVRGELAVLKPEELEGVRKVMLLELKENGLKNSALFSEWFRIPQSPSMSQEILDFVMTRPAEKIALLGMLHGRKEWKDHPIMKSLTFEQLVRGLTDMEFDYKRDDLIKNIVSRFSRLSDIPPTDLAAAKAVMLDYLKNHKSVQTVDLATRHWFSLPWAFDPGVEDVALAMRTNEERHEFILSQLVRGERMDFLKHHPELIASAPKYALAKAVRDAGDKMPADFLEFLLDSDTTKTADDRIAEKLDGAAKSPKFASIVSRLIERGAADREVAKQISFIPEATAHPEWVDTLIARGKANDELISWMLSRPGIWKANPKWMTAILKATRDFGGHDLDMHFVSALDRPEWRAFPEWRGWVDTIMAKEHPTSGLFRSNILRPEDIDSLLAKKSQYTDENIVGYLMKEMKSPGKPTYPEFKDHDWVRVRLDQVVQRGSGEGDNAILREVMSDPKWANESGWVDQIVKRGAADEALAEYVLSKPYSAAHPEWLRALLTRGMKDGDLGSLDRLINAHVLSKAHWKNHPEVKEAMGGKKMSASDLRMVFRKPGDPAPLFQDAAKRSRAYRGPQPWKALSSYSTKDLEILALANIDRDHSDYMNMETLRTLAQRNLVGRKDPRVAEWVREDLTRTSGRLDLLTGIGVSDPSVEKAVRDFWREIHPVDTDEKKTMRNLLVHELSEAVTAKDKSLIPIALEALQTPGEKMHFLRWGGMEMLGRIDIKQDPELRRVLLEALNDGSEYIRGDAIANLERIGESSPEYVAKIRDMAEKEKNFFVTKELNPAAARVAKLGDCRAGFAALAGK